MILLDLGLPDIDGIDVCRQLRRTSANPIIVLTADGAEDRKIDALDMGADDYVTKPFSMPELLARVRVALRHRQAVRGLPGTGGAIEVGALSIDLDAHLAHVHGQELRLTRKEFALLGLLAANAGRVLTHRAILDEVWGPDQTLDTLRTHVTLLRRKIGDGAGHPPHRDRARRRLPPPAAGVLTARRDLASGPIGRRRGRATCAAWWAPGWSRGRWPRRR